MSLAIPLAIQMLAVGAPEVLVAKEARAWGLAPEPLSTWFEPGSLPGGG